jgi:hypothetical protein
MKCQLQCGPELEQSTATHPRATPLSSAFAMLTSAEKCQAEGGAELERDSKDMPATGAPQSYDSERNISLASTCQSQGGGSDLGRSMATPTLGDPLSSALVMSTPGKICPPHVSSALPAGVYFGCATAVDGGPTLSCPSPPTFATGDFGRPCATATLTSSDSERNISPAITCLSQDEAGLERDSLAAHTPAAVAPQSSASERNISPAITGQSQDRAELELDSTSARTPTASAPPSSASERYTSPSITCAGSSATVRPFLLLLFGRTGNRC